MRTTDIQSPWDDTRDLPDEDFRSIYGPQAERQRIVAWIITMERKYAALAIQMQELRSLNTLDT